MTHTPHELAADFPEHRDKIHDLKESDAHFARLADEYHRVNRAIHRAETGVEPVSDEAERDMRKRRMSLKDEIAARLKRD
ncbi:MAG: YdcH family protein [Rhodovibrionaceae bacterium]|nr:YdcH family protein [Rhodovibrionaceae bacterium]